MDASFLLPAEKEVEVYTSLLSSELIKAREILSYYLLQLLEKSERIQGILSKKLKHLPGCSTCFTGVSNEDVIVLSSLS